MSLKEIETTQTPGQFHWQNEESDVDRHNRPAARARRMAKRLIIPVIVISILMAALLSAPTRALGGRFRDLRDCNERSGMQRV